LILKVDLGNIIVNNIAEDDVEDLETEVAVVNAMVNMNRADMKINDLG